MHPTFEGGEDARLILNEAEDELRDWVPTHEIITSNAGALGANAMPGAGGSMVNSPTTEAAAREKLGREGLVGDSHSVAETTTTTTTTTEPPVVQTA